MREHEWNQVEVSPSISIPFEWRDPTPGGENLGRAEFQVCTKFKRGKIVEYWVYPKHTQLTDCWHWKGEYHDFTINCYQGLNHEGAWLIHYCKEHKAVSFNVYAPTNAGFIWLDCHGITFTKTKWEE